MTDIVAAARKVAVATAGMVGARWVVRAAGPIPLEMGASAADIAPVATGAAAYHDGRFHNTEPSTEVVPDSGMLWQALTRRGSGRPPGKVPLATAEHPEQAAELAVTWYGHATALVEVDGYRILTDPVWSERVSPSPLVGPARLHPVPAPLSSLPPVDAVVISHDHYDHLDLRTVRALVRSQTAPFVVPIGIGAHLRKWRVPDHRIIELDWGTSTPIHKAGREPLTVTCTEARHFSGRGLSRNLTLWASWVFAGPRHRAYFGGDTGYTKAFAEIGATQGPFDLTLLPIGAYDVHWPDIHMNPEEAVRAHADLCVGDVGYGALVPIHWATFNLALHGWSEPVRRLVTAAERAGTRVVVPLPGERVATVAVAQQVSWWEDVR